ncbi:MAG: hypothetical protein HY648_11010 [Acidobacteria bacterium]|nr:hypothetical protein [Acidobacteriota bacterium]
MRRTSPIMTLLAAAGMLLAQDLYSQSLADLARQERERKAQERDGKVYTNEDVRQLPPSSPLPSSPAAPAQEGGRSAAPAGEAAGAAEKAPEKTAEDQEKAKAALEKEYRERFAQLRERLSFEEQKLNVMQRELNLMQMQFYSDPNVALREQTFRGEINTRTTDIETQKQAVEKAKEAITDLEEELRKKDLPPGWAR